MRRGARGIALQDSHGNESPACLRITTDYATPRTGDREFIAMPHDRRSSMVRAGGPIRDAIPGHPGASFRDR